MKPKTGGALSNYGAPPEAALLDLDMPEMDGFELSQAIKIDRQLFAVRLILTLSFGNRGDGQTAREIGFSASLMKPVRQSQPFDCLIDVLGKGETASTPPGDPVYAAFSRGKQTGAANANFDRRGQSGQSKSGAAAN